MRRTFLFMVMVVLAGAPAFAQSFTEEFEDITTLAGAGWFTQNNSTTLGTTSWGPISAALEMRDQGPSEFQGNTTVFPAYSGSGYIADNFNATTGVGTISDWLMTPAVTISDGDVVSFWTRTGTGSTYPDRLELRMSLAGASTDCGTLPEDVGDFTNLLVEVNPTLTVGGYPETWTQYSVTISGVGAPTLGRFALRYYVTSGGPSGSNSNYIGVDLFEYVAGSAAPPNDLCADAETIVCDSVNNGTTIDATIDDAFPFCGTSISSPGVWYRIIGTGGDITVDTCTGTSFDTKISVYTDGCDPVATTCVGGNDDFCGLQSSVTWTSSPGVEYLVLVHAYGGATGDFTLTSTCASAGPAIALTKTVGTVPATCAATDTITVGSGTPVYYCYTVENTGDVTFEFHTLEDDQLGTLFANFPQTLPPAATFEFIVEETISGASVTNTGTWTAKDVIPGYTFDDTIQVDFVDISTSGSAFTLPDDGTIQVPIGFSFNFYGVPYTDFWVSSNGFMSDADYGSGCCSGQDLPDAFTPNGVIAGWWEDLDPAEPGAGLYYETQGTAPNRVFIVQFSDVQHFPSGNPVTFQYKLFEDSGLIEVHYLAAPSDGGNHTAGVENQDGTIATLYYYGTGALTTPLAVQYIPDAVQEATASDTATVNISDPDITVNPASLLFSQLSGEVNTLPMDIGNVGTEPLDWNIEEAQPRSIPPSDGNFVRGANPPSFAAAPTGHKPTPGGSGVPMQTLLPGTFAIATESAFANHVQFDSDAPEVLVNIAPATGTFWAGDFVGGDLTKTVQIKDTNELVTVDKATGAETLIGALPAPPGFPDEIYTGLTFDPSTGNTYASSCDITTSTLWQVDVTTPGVTAIGTITNSPCSIAIAADAAGQLYTFDLVNDTLLSVDKATGAGTVIGSLGFDANFGQGMDYDAGTDTMYLAAFNNGTFQAELRIADLTTGNTALVGPLGGAGSGVQLGWVGFDFLDSPCANPSDVPWLSVSPINGTIAPAGSTTVDVTADSTGLAVGLYEAVLCVFSNDPDEPLVPVPTTLEVLIPVELMSIDVE
jgi:hypothetical protein